LGRPLGRCPCANDDLSDLSYCDQMGAPRRLALVCCGVAHKQVGCALLVSSRAPIVRRILLVVSVVLCLGGCKPYKSEAEVVDAPNPDVPMVSSAATEEAQQPVAESVGYYQIGDTKVTLRYATVLTAKEGVLQILLTPDVLTDEEKAGLEQNPNFPGLSLMMKRTHEYQNRYPFVLVEFKDDGTLTAQEAKSFYIMASSIHVPNHTDNINGILPRGLYQLEQLERNGVAVTLKFKGQEEIGGEVRSWDFDVQG